MNSLNGPLRRFLESALIVKSNYRAEYKITNEEIDSLQSNINFDERIEDELKYMLVNEMIKNKGISISKDRDCLFTKYSAESGILSIVALSMNHNGTVVNFRYGKPIN